MIFDMYINITITEECYRLYGSNLGFDSLSRYCEYNREFLTNGKSSPTLAKGIQQISTKLVEVYALSYDEVIKYISEYFNKRLWLEYMSVLNHRNKLLGYFIPN